MVLFFSLHSVAQSPIFQNISKEQGLAHDYILALCHDQKGFVWVGSYRGLQRYDGTEFLNYFHSNTDSSTLSNGVVHDVFEDNKGRLWVATEHGLNLFDPVKNAFKRYYAPAKVLKEYAQHFRCIVQEEDGTFWLATYGGGLFSFDEKSNTWEHFYHLEKADKSLPSNFVNTLTVDSKGNIWIGTESGGLCRFDKATKGFTSFDSRHGFLDNTVTTIKENKQGDLFIGTWRGGLHLFNPASSYTQPIKNLPPSLSKPATIRTLELNEDGTLWIATQHGLWLYNPHTSCFKAYRHNPLDQTSIAFDYIWSLHKDLHSRLWIGTFGGGLSLFNPMQNRFVCIREGKDLCSLEDENVSAVLQDSKGRVWIASGSNGVTIYESNASCTIGRKIKHLFKGTQTYVIYEDRLHKIWCETGGVVYRFGEDLVQEAQWNLSDHAAQETIGFTLYAIAEDDEGNLWMGGWNTGLICLPARERRKKSYAKSDFKFFKHDSKDSKSISNNIIWSILPYKDKLWIGAGNGLEVYQSSQGFSQVSDTITSSVYSMLLQSEKVIWLATAGNGLVKLDPRTHKAEGVKSTSLLKHQALFDIYENKGNLWISSDAGLFYFHVKSQDTYCYTVQDGLPTNSFLLHASSILDKKILFGTSKGIAALDPARFHVNANRPTPVLSDIRVFDRSISLEQGDDSNKKLKQSLQMTRELELMHSENVLTLAFSSIQFEATGKVQYAYRLKGFDKVWYQTDHTKRFATYTNLNSGSYVFEVKVANSDGVWNDEATKLKIIILPPWWQTYWFRAFIGILFLVIVWAIFYLRTRTIKKRNKVLEREVRARTQDLQESNELLKEQNEEILRQSERILEQQKEIMDRGLSIEEKNQSLVSSNKLKDMLFTVVAHDIRNPVNNITALIGMASTSASEHLKELLLQADKQAQNLRTLTTDLLDWSIFQGEDIRLQKERVSVDQLCSELYIELQPSAQTKNIVLEVEVNVSYDLLVDKNALKTVVRNLIANAIKFTFTGGKVHIKCMSDKSKGKVFIQVQDTGVGIEKEKLSSLFEFSPAKRSRGTTGEMGSGLGLFFSYELNKLNNGEMHVESQLGIGTTFTIAFPGFEPEAREIIHPLSVSSKETKQESVGSLEFFPITGKIIFLVDDDPVLRNALNQYLCDMVEICQFGTAEQALKEASKIVPDMMIVDVNLPGMSGLELVKRIKSGENTSHIATFILSGETRPEWMVKGFEFGADAYLTKPFDRVMLLQKISHYFEQQEKKINRYLFEPYAKVESLSENPINKVFLQEVVGIIEENLSNSDLGTDLICRAMGMSRSSLYRKLKGLTGYTVTDFVKNIRFKKSLEMLKEGRFNVSQVAYEVGFNSLSYFTSSFKKHFGYSPSEIQRKGL